MKNKIEIAVISDLHAFDASNPQYKDNPPSFLTIDNPQVRSDYHPVNDLYKLISKNNLSADYLVCCGDIGHKAHPIHISNGWSEVQNISNALKCRKVLSTSGNHDVDSRYTYNDHDAKGVLLSLDPLYPVDGEDFCNKYFAKNYTIIEEDFCRFVCLNSAAYHGLGPNEQASYIPPEYNHGRVSAITLNFLAQELKELDNKPINILVCHHHPFKHDGLKIEDYSSMVGGEDLIKLLDGSQTGEWLIIHGHRHFPCIDYAAGGSQSPVVFSAGSFSAALYGELQTKARNQFYIISLDLTEIEKYCGLVGKFHSWDWVLGDGWVNSGSFSGLPKLGGFGNRDKITKIAKRIINIADENAGIFMKRQEILNKIPELSYLLPNDIASVINCLKNESSVRVQTNQDYTEFEIYKEN